jgi:hypothetical protein
MNRSTGAGLAVAVTLVSALSGCGGSVSAAQSPACKVAQQTENDMGSGAVDGTAMGTYAAALAGSGATGQLSIPVKAAITDARNAQQDVSDGDMTQYQQDAKSFLTDVSMIQGDCMHGIQ